MSVTSDAIAAVKAETDALDARVKAKLEEAEKKVVDVPTAEELAVLVDVAAKLKGMAV